MEEHTSSVSGSRSKTAGPPPKQGEKAVHIIHVPVEQIESELHVTGLARGPVTPATLSQVAKHIGQPEPTDIIVFAKQPWHFAGPNGQPKALRSHPQVHHDFPETVLVLGKNDQAVWWSEEPFQVTKVVPSDHPPNSARFPEADNGAPLYPFNGPDPLVTRIEPHSNGNLFVARSGVPKADAAKHMYKVSFMIDNEPIDPDAYCSGGN
jgi:hypothetical protein